MTLTTKKKDLEFLKDYAKRMEQHTFATPKDHLLDMLGWLIGYYENKTASTPKEYLEDLINSPKNIYVEIYHSERVRLLYNWVNYKTIVGF